MKIPAWVNDRIAELGVHVLNDDLTRQEAAEELAGKIKADNGIFLSELLTEWSRNKIQSWLVSKTRDMAQGREVPGQARLPFEELPPHLEIAPGRLAHQNVMTGRDWDNALAIWKNRFVEAEASFRRFERCYTVVRPLLTDPELTTADVADQIAGGDFGEAAAT